MSSEIIHNQEDNAMIPPWDLLDHRMAFNSEVSSQLIGGDYHTNQYLASHKGHKYVKLLNPTLNFVKLLLDKIKDPSVLLLRGCGGLLQSPGFSFDKFKSITNLEISGFPHLATLPENTISQMTQLQSLNLSYLQINHLPDNLFDNNRESLRSLILRGCSNIPVLPDLPLPMTRLEYLDLSYLPIETLPPGFSSDLLRSLILRGCSELQSLKGIALERLEFLDLCHCTSMIAQTLYIGSSFTVLDLSYTAFHWHNLQADKITHLFFRNANLRFLHTSSYSMHNIKVCDLSGNQGLRDISILEINRVEALNLSRTAIESIDLLSKLTLLRTLVLRECTSLKQLPTIEQLEYLEVLDLSGCEIMCELPRGLSKQRRLKELNLCGCKSLTELEEGLFDDMISLEKLDLSNTDIKNLLPSLDNLISRGTAINHSCDSAIESSSSVPTELSNTDTQREFHIVSTFINDSGFDKFKYEFTKLNHYISSLEKKLTRSVTEEEAVRVNMQFKSMRGGLEYIRGKLDLLESSQNCKSSEELLHKLIGFDYRIYDDDDSSILKNLLRTVAKLKQLVPPTPPLPTEPHEERTNEDDIDLWQWLPEEYPQNGYKPDQINKYESLTPIQKNCLLYFTCLAMAIEGKGIHERILIQLWYGEGFFDPMLYANSTSNLIPEMSSGSPHTYDSGQASASNTNSTIEEIGRDILDSLLKEDFIWSIRKKKWYMLSNTSFVIKKAMEKHWFDFNKRGKLTPHFGISRTACLFKSTIGHRSSSKVWLNYTKTSRELESFKTVHTLLYIDELAVDINTKWFSSMTNLHVLHLVNLGSTSKQINIVDLDFLEELKKMKKLRLLSLESFAAICKLPDSICHLNDLRILNLKYCSNLVELPAGIASLTNLIILDLTQCHLLPELPKGLTSLSKLEVLKGFPITYDVSGKQSRKACTLRELLKLESLRKLNLVVNRDSFPDTMDLQVLRSMKKIRNLMITWKQNIYKEVAVEKRALRQSRWKQIKCWGAHNEIEEDELLASSCLENLNKLVLCCVPFETEPNWLNPTELSNLEKLYIVGGSLRTLFQDNTDRIRWNIKTLKLKYLSNLYMDWRNILGKFPCLTWIGEDACPHTDNYRECYKDLERPTPEYLIWKQLASSTAPSQPYSSLSSNPWDI